MHGAARPGVSIVTTTATLCVSAQVAAALLVVPRAQTMPFVLTPTPTLISIRLMRCCQRFLNRPAIRQALAHQWVRKTESVSPDTKRERLSEIGQESIGATVVRLLSTSCPAAIVGGVWAVIVDAVERVATRWPGAHVGVERREVVQPPVAHFNAPTAIEVVSGAPKVVTAVFGLFPCGELTAVAHAVGSDGRNSSGARLSAGHLSLLRRRVVQGRRWCYQHSRRPSSILSPEQISWFDAGHMLPVVWRTVERGQ